MYREMLKSKIHRAVVTEANLNYIGSITIDEDLMEKADIVENEKVLIVDVNNGARFETYVIPGKTGSGIICLNGAAARLVQVEDKVIIISFALLNEVELKNHKPTVVYVGDKNEIKQIKTQGNDLV
ncbi:aspartate 1-decarboxylase [Ruminiclostridium cellobioparum]|uniref:Aspartate 1-decarboxylase n=1 Tax=Ruminiclostridium cellobioparum subsp. termitidis CT1112 TaxID=1195236 RepID=S0FKL5_RUMCE|nr:aspartate 1-decarboxylase [Ruminiclostridium cellobioparum]EMS72755.1 L-aspartate-alpha-decarboxylase [Ruminiclostridium cellobioparum subsp. termitidis CT1112]